MKKISLCMAVLASLFLSACALYDNTGDSDRLVTLEDSAYFLKVRKAILMNDRQWLSTQVALPLCCFPDKANSFIRTRADFIAHYDEVINPYIREVVRRQERHKLKKDWAGVVVGQEAMWIVPFGPLKGPVTYQIYAIKNTPPPGFVFPVRKPKKENGLGALFGKKKAGTPPPAKEGQKPPPEEEKKGILHWLMERD